MSYQIDHVFVLTAAPEAACRMLADALFSVAPRRDHPGQGTANACVHMENGYLELLWIDRPDEAVSDLTRPTGLDERARWRETGASPIGVALRGPADAPPPFAWRDYRPRFMPGDAAIAIADEPAARGAPLVFVLPGGLAGHKVAVDHANGARRITSMAIGSAPAPDASPSLAMLRRQGLCRIDVAAVPSLDIELDHGRHGRSLDLAPHAPLTLTW
jgi:hypothetical protein